MAAVVIHYNALKLDDVCLLLFYLELKQSDALLKIREVITHSLREIVDVTLGCLDYFHMCCG